MDLNRTSPNSSGHVISNLEQVLWWIGLVELFVFLIGTPMNALVFYLTYLIRKNNTVSFTSKRVITEMFIVSMSLADLLFCVGHAPMMYLSYNREIILSKIPCLTLFAITHASTVASSLSLLWLNINKFLHLHRPLHYFLYITKLRAIACIAVGWSVSISWGLFFVLGPFTSHDSQCNLYLHHKSVYVVFASVFFVVPSLVSLLISIYVAIVVVETKTNHDQKRFLYVHRRRGIPRNEILLCQRDANECESFGVRISISQNNHRLGSNVTSKTYRNYVRRRAFSPTYWPPPETFTQSSSSSRRMAHIRRISFVFTTTIWSSLTVLPYRIAFILTNLPKPPTNETPNSHIGELVYFILFAIMTSNAAGNPFITILTQREYSGWLKRFWKKIFNYKSTSIPSPPTVNGSAGHKYRCSFPTSDETTDIGQITNSPSPRMPCRLKA